MVGKRFNNLRQLSLPRTTIVAFIIGVIVPLVSAVIPPIIEYFRTHSDFTYFREDPVFFTGKVAYSLQISNHGRVVEHDVQVWIATSKEDNDVMLTVEVDPTYSQGLLQPIRIHDEAGYKVIVLGDMRAGEIARLSIMKKWETISIYPDKKLRSYPAFVEKILSSERIAKFVPKAGSVWDRSFPSLAWFITSVVFLIGLGLLFLYVSQARNGNLCSGQKNFEDDHDSL